MNPPPRQSEVAAGGDNGDSVGEKAALGGNLGHLFCQSDVAIETGFRPGDRGALLYHCCCCCKALLKQFGFGPVKLPRFLTAKTHVNTRTLSTCIIYGAAEAIYYTDALALVIILPLFVAGAH